MLHSECDDEFVFEELVDAARVWEFVVSYIDLPIS